MEGILSQVTKESFFMALLMFVLGFAAAFIGFYLWKRIQQVNSNAADVIALGV